MPPKKRKAPTDTPAVSVVNANTAVKGRGRGKAVSTTVSTVPSAEKGRGSITKGRKGKEQKKVEVEAEPSSAAREAINKLKESDSSTKKRQAKPDALFPYASTAKVFEDYDCMLNQTNIGQNNNKYYIIQVLEVVGRFYAWNRWGRVGESGQNAMKGPINKEQAIADFEKKFKDKTKNDWVNRKNFKPAAGKYTLIEMDDTEEEEAPVKKKPKIDVVDGIKQLVAPSKLDSDTQALMKFIFDNDMFNDAMKEMEIDVKKMPLGKLSKAQIAKGFEVLEEIEQCLKTNSRGRLNELSSRFYTLIPHDFGRNVPPVIGDAETLRKKMDMLLTLGDIEIAQQLNKEKDKSITGNTTSIPNPVDISYNLLDCDLKLIDKKSQEFKIIENYTNATCGSFRKFEIQNVWKVQRNSEKTRFSQHDDIAYRKLLWHGTKVAVVAAILKGGLRIMPHSGGRMGKGIYFASEHSKSAGYVGCAPNGVGIMFLNEVALGKEHHMLQGDHSLTTAPKGYDSIVAVGCTEPDPKQDITMTIEGKQVIVPQGKPVHQANGRGSHFSQSEYLIYKESQCHIRYMLSIKFR